MKKNNIRYFIASRTFPWLIGLLLLSSLLLFSVAKNLADKQNYQRHQQTVDRFYEHVASTLASLEQQVVNIANNELIINSLIDPQGRESYIPLFIRSFSLAGISDAYLGVTDFSGTVLAQNDIAAIADLIRQDRWREISLERSESYRSLTQAGLIISAPIRFADIAEGAVVATISVRSLAPLFSMNNIDGLIIYTDINDNVIYSSDNSIVGIGEQYQKQEQLKDWFVVESPLSDDGYRIVSAESKKTLYGKIYWIFIFMLVAILIAFISMVMSVSLSSRLVSNTLSNFVDILRNKNQENNVAIGSNNLDELLTINEQFDYLVKDLTEAKLLRKNIQSIINSLNESLVVFNFDGSVRIANHAFDKLLNKIQSNKQTPLEIIITEDVGSDISIRQKNDGLTIDTVLDVNRNIDDFECAYNLYAQAREDVMDCVIHWSRSLYYSRDGQLEGVILIGVDVTQSREFEKELRLKDLIVEEAGNGIVIADARLHDLPLIYCNQSFLDMTGYAKEEIIGKNCRFLQGEKTDPEVVARLRQAINHEERITETVLNYRKDGSAFYNHLMLAPIRNARGRLIYYLGIQLDVTKQIEADQALLEAKAKAEESAQLKSQFLASMSHEIRTPMNGVLGMLGLLSKTQLNENQQRYTDLATSSAESLLKIINDILDFSKVEAGKIELEEIEFDLIELLSNFSETMAQRAEEKGLEFILDVTDVDVAKVSGDPGRLRQVLTNLVSNAIKFTHLGEVVVQVRLAQKNSEQYRLYCSVIDTGIGIPEDKFDSLFESFSQVDSSTTRKYGGTGLGLSIVRQLCQLMGGDVRVSNRLCGGSEFIFEIDLGASSDYQSIAESLHFDQLSVLIIDKNESVRDTLLRQLSIWKVRARALDSVDEIAVAIEQEDTFDLILLGSDSHGISADKLVTVLAEDHRFEKTKRVLMTRLMVNADGVSLDGVFPKPVTPRDLQCALNLCLNQKTFAASSVPANVVQEKSIQGLVENQQQEQDEIRTCRRLLLVEDNMINQQVALGVLEGLGYSADIAANGLEAITALQQAPKEAPYELILMDCQMPEMDGYEATRAIRHGQSPNPDIPIIAMTANAMKGDKEKCLAAGMNDYLSKPIDPDALRVSLQRWLPTLSQGRGRTESEESVWDRSGFMQRVMENQTLADKLIHLFKQDAPKTIEQLEQAVRHGDAKTVGMVAHKLKGSVVNLGGIELAELAQQIEAAGRENNIQAINQLWPNVRPHYNRLIHSIEQSNQG